MAFFAPLQVFSIANNPTTQPAHANAWSYNLHCKHCKLADFFFSAAEVTPPSTLTHYPHIWLSANGQKISLYCS